MRIIISKFERVLKIEIILIWRVNPVGLSNVPRPLVPQENNLKHSPVKTGSLLYILFETSMDVSSIFISYHASFLSNP